MKRARLDAPLWDLLQSAPSAKSAVSAFSRFLWFKTVEKSDVAGVV
jgi:hypothetical protein